MYTIRTDYRDETVIEKSRFICTLKKVSSETEAQDFIKAVKKEFWDGTHNCSAYIIDELLHVDYSDENKKLYYNEIIHSIIDTSIADKFIVALCRLIQNLTIDNLHIIGDIFDRGPRADIIMKELMNFHDVDIQWGNHDMVWMGAATGQLACIAAVIRTSIRYGNLDLIEDGYGINMVPLATFAMDAYKDDPCERFVLKNSTDEERSKKETEMNRKMHKAIAIIRFKLEGQLVQKWSDCGM